MDPLLHDQTQYPSIYPLDTHPSLPTSIQHSFGIYSAKPVFYHHYYAILQWWLHHLLLCFILVITLYYYHNILVPVTLLSFLAPTCCSCNLSAAVTVCDYRTTIWLKFINCLCPFHFLSALYFLDVASVFLHPSIHTGGTSTKVLATQHRKHSMNSEQKCNHICLRKYTHVTFHDQAQGSVKPPAPPSSRTRI